MLAHAVDDEVGFVVLVECSVQLDCFAVVAVGPQFLAEPAGVLRNQAVGGAEDGAGRAVVLFEADRLARSEEHTSELQSLMRISYAVFCLNTNKKENYQ